MNQAKKTTMSSDSARSSSSANPYVSPPESNESTSIVGRPNANRPFPVAHKSPGVSILFAVLIIWCLLIAFGSFQTQASTDFRRPLIVMLTMGTFLGIWALALKSRKARA